jgi:ubiquinone/menaquinone biosynthesis C-methylase UbiE
MTDETYELTARAAEFYEATFVPALFRDWAGRLVDFAGVAAGTRVLDVACGTGIVARTAADRTGSGASVTGLDINEAMLAVARRGDPTVRWVAGDARHLPFGDGEFDVVLSQAALMFFGDRVAALREMARVARPDATIAVQVPGRLAGSPGYVALTDVVARHAGPEVTGVLASYFSVGEPDLLRELAAGAGLTITRLQTWTGATRLSSLAEFLDVELLPIADRVEPAVRGKILADAAEALSPFVDGDGSIAAPIEVHLVALARKAGVTAG